MELGLEGRVAIVNGASRGLGRAIAAALAAEGVRLVVSSRDRLAIERAAAELAAEHGAEVLPVAADVTTPATAAELAAAAKGRFGRLDMLVNNSGGPPRGRFADFDDDAWQEAFALLVLNVVRMVRACRPLLAESGHGRVVTVASTSVRQPIPDLLLSTSLRAAVAALGKSLADELAEAAITVNTVLPGRILTDRLREGYAARAAASGTGLDDLIRAEGASGVPLGRIGEPHELASLVAYLCSDGAAYLTGQLIAVDGGLVRGIY